MSADGALVYFSYSGGLVCDPGLLGVQSVTRDGNKFDILSPIRVGHGGWRPIPMFSAKRLGEELEGFSLPFELFGFAAHPSINDDGTPAVLLTNDHAEPSSLPRDTIPVLIPPSRDEQLVGVAERMLLEAMEEVRVRTGQWWAGRSAEALTGNQHISFAIDGEHIALDRLSIACRQTRPFSGTRRLTPELWSDIWASVASQKRSPAHLLLLSDAIYFYCLRDFRLAILALTTSLESGRDALFSRLRLSVRGTDILKHLTINLEAKAGRNLMVERPAHYEFLKAIWVARGNAAHGKPIHWRTPDEEFGTRPAELFFQPATEILEWLSGIDQ